MQRRLVDDERLISYSIKDAGFTALVTGPTGSGKTLSLRPLIEHLGTEEVVIVATDPRLAPLDGLGAKVLPCWVEPGVTGAELKAQAEAAKGRMDGFHRDLILAANNPDIVVPKVVVHDNLSNTGDILAWSIARPGEQLSQPQWGTLARRAIELVNLYRGLQIRGLARIINCTSGHTKDEMGRTVPSLFIGTGGQLAPRHVPRYVDYQFHLKTYYDKSAATAGSDGMVRQFQTCEMDGIIAKGAPQLETPFVKADWWEIYCKLMGVGADAAKAG